MLEETREEAARQLSQLREASARELESLRTSLTSKLKGVEEEMERLKSCSEADRLSREAEAKQEVGRVGHALSWVTHRLHSQQKLSCAAWTLPLHRSTA